MNGTIHFAVGFTTVGVDLSTRGAGLVADIQLTSRAAREIPRATTLGDPAGLRVHSTGRNAFEARVSHQDQCGDAHAVQKKNDHYPGGKQYQCLGKPAFPPEKNQPDDGERENQPDAFETRAPGRNDYGKTRDTNRHG